MKKFLAITMVFVLALTMVLTGCSKEEEIKNQDKESASAYETTNTKTKEESYVTAPGQLPIVKEPITLNVLLAKDPYVDEYTPDKNEAIKWWIERTGINLKFNVVGGDITQMNQTLSLSLASGDYPDMYMGFKQNLSQLSLYGSQGVYIPLNDLIENYGYEINNVIKEYPSYLDYYRCDDGNIYGLGDAIYQQNKGWSWQLFLYQPWLEKLNLKPPTNLDEFHDMLVAFKTNDPNGNGETDEIPFTGAEKGFRTQIHKYILSSFVIPHSIPERVGKPGKPHITADGKVDVAFNKPEFKEGLKYLKGLYDEGLIDAEAFTRDNKQLKQLTGSEVNVVGAVPGGWLGSFVQVGTPREKEWIMASPIKGPEGKYYPEYNPEADFNDAQVVITNACKYPEAAFRLIDDMFNQECSRMLRNGKEGVGWRKAKPGELDANGEQADWKQLIRFGEQRNDIFGQVGIEFSPASRPKLVDDNYELGGPITNTMINNKIIKDEYTPLMNFDELVMPSVAFSEDMNAELASISPAINDYVSEIIARSILGDYNIKGKWDDYLKELNNLGLNRYLEIYQVAYDSYLAKTKK